MPPRTRKPGEFCWINIIAARPAEVRDFFSRLLGWTYGEIPGMGHLIQVDGRKMGGLFDLEAPTTPPGTRPVIGVMVRVADAGAMAERVRALGGRAQPPMDIGPNGRMVVCHDPGGANFDLWEPRGESASDVDGAVQGAFSWFEVLSGDTAREAKFYSDLFGWTAAAMPMPGFTYTTFSLGETAVAGMMPISAAGPGAMPCWTAYFTVKDVDASAALAQRLGAKLFVPVTAIPAVGRFCGVTSPQGLWFYLMQYER